MFSHEWPVIRALIGAIAARHPRGLACYPLFPFSNRIDKGTFTFEGTAGAGVPDAISAILGVAGDTFSVLLAVSTLFFLTRKCT